MSVRATAVEPYTRVGADMGISARTVVPWPTWLSTTSTPSSAPTWSASPRSPLPREGSAPACSVVVHGDDDPPILAYDLHACLGRPGVLGHVRERLGHDVVRRCLDRLGKPVGRDVDVDGHRCPRDERLTAGASPRSVSTAG